MLYVTICYISFLLKKFTPCIKCVCLSEIFLIATASIVFMQFENIRKKFYIFYIRRFQYG